VTKIFVHKNFYDKNVCSYNFFVKNLRSHTFLRWKFFVAKTFVINIFYHINPFHRKRWNHVTLYSPRDSGGPSHYLLQLCIFCATLRWKNKPTIKERFGLMHADGRLLVAYVSNIRSFRLLMVSYHFRFFFRVLPYDSKYDGVLDSLQDAVEFGRNGGRCESKFSCITT